jgi:hypothetical protein
MQKVIILFVLLILNSMAHAEDVQRLVLDKVNFQISAKEWVSTQKALLSVDINVTLNNADLVKARADILQKLNSIVKGDWHITQFDRGQDSSLLEKLYARAEIRIEQDKLTNIYENAKAASKPGANYTIAAIEFKPDLDDIQSVKNKLRARLYKEVTVEMERINATFGMQQYKVHRITFSEGEAVADARTFERNNKRALMMAAPTAANQALTVSNEITMTAIVDVASNRTVGN